jgi:hypothetical protein
MNLGLGFVYVPQTDSGLLMRKRSAHSSWSIHPIRRTDLFSATPVSQPFVFLRPGLVLAWHHPRAINLVRHLAGRSDIAFGDSSIRRSVVSKRSELFPGVYRDSNIAIVSTHRHAGVGGYPENILPQITSFWLTSLKQRMLSCRYRAHCAAHAHQF